MSLPKEAYGTKFPFQCANHPDQKTDVNVYFLVEQGVPICETCGDDLELVGPEPEKKPDSVHQAIMDAAYKKWGPDTRKYKDFLNKLDVKERRAVVIGNLNYQVENGGFMQWDFNSYSEGYEYLKEALTTIGTVNAIKVLSLTNQALSILKEHKDELRLWEEESAEEEDLEPRLDKKSLNKLDDAYYEINDAFMKECEEFFSKE